MYACVCECVCLCLESIAHGDCQPTVNCSWFTRLVRVCVSGQRSRAAPLTRWKECAFPSFPASPPSCPLASTETASALAFETSVQPDYRWARPPEPCLPACLYQPLLNWDPNAPDLLEWHVAAILKEGSSAALFDVHHCVRSRPASPRGSVFSVRDEISLPS